MQELARLHQALFVARSAAERTEALARVLEAADAATAAWLIYFLSGKKFKKVFTTDELIEQIRPDLNLPDWLWEASLQASTDALEALALLRGRPQPWEDDPLLQQLDLNLSAIDVNFLRPLFDRLSPASLKLLFQLLTGRALFSGLEAELAAALQQVYRMPARRSVEWLFESWQPHEIETHLVVQTTEAGEAVRTFAVVETIHHADLQSLVLGDYLYEGYLVGKRIRIKKHSDESITCWVSRMPLPPHPIKPLAELTRLLPAGTELEGMLEVSRKGQPVDEAKLIPALLQGSKGLSCTLVLYDALELNQTSLLLQPLHRRKAALGQFASGFILPESSYVVHGQAVQNQATLSQLFQQHAHQLPNGLILKHRESTYNDAQFRWLHVPLPDRTLRAVLVYFELLSMTERCAILTFALPEGQALLPLCTVELTFSSEDWKELVLFVKEKKIDKFGPVLQVAPERAYTLTYAGIKANKRKKAGVELADPRLESPADFFPADTAKPLADLKREWMIV